MKLFTFERDFEEIDEFMNRINNWRNLHQEIKVLDYDFGYDEEGELETVVVKWDAR